MRVSHYYKRLFFVPFSPYFKALSWPTFQVCRAKWPRNLTKNASIPKQPEESGIGQKAPQTFDSERVTIAQGQGTSENQKGGVIPKMILQVVSVYF
jgi:hypothetical protein